MTLSTHRFCYDTVCVVTQDLLILTIRQYCTKRLPDGTLIYPEWWLPCYDLSTEFHLFVSDYRDRLATVRNGSGSDSQACHNSWIVKPAGGTRALGHTIVTSADEAGLRRIAALCPKVDILFSSTDPTTVTGVRPLSTPVGDKIAQLLIYRPLCVYEKKFDLRVFVLVRSFVPFDGKRDLQCPVYMYCRRHKYCMYAFYVVFYSTALYRMFVIYVYTAYMHQLFYARLANFKYDTAALECDPEVALTVSAYNDNAEIAGRQGRLSRNQLRRALEKEYAALIQSEKCVSNSPNMPTIPPSFPWAKLVDDIQTLCTELFAQSAPSIGSWPRSSAYYSLDIMVDASHAPYKYTPKLIEVNFNGDWDGVDRACELDRQDALLLQQEQQQQQAGLQQKGDAAHTTHSTDKTYAEYTPPQSEPRFAFQDWIEDVMTVLGTGAALDDNPRLIRLVHTDNTAS